MPSHLASHGDTQAERDPLALRHELAASDLRLAVARLSRLLRRSANSDLTLSQLSALVSVGAWGRIKMGDLAAIEGVAAATLTRTIGFLDSYGLIQRYENPHDGRSSLVGLSEEGSKLFETLKHQGTAALMRRLVALDESELCLIEAAVPALIKLTETDSCKGPSASMQASDWKNQ